MERRFSTRSSPRLQVRVRNEILRFGKYFEHLSYLRNWMGLRSSRVSWAQLLNCVDRGAAKRITLLLPRGSIWTLFSVSLKSRETERHCDG